MPSLRDDLSPPFLLLGLAIAALVAADYLLVPGLFSVGDDLTLAYGGLLVAFAFAYGCRPLRESRCGVLVTSLFLMLFATVQYVRGIREPVMPYGLFAVALVAFCYELYKLGSGRLRRGHVP